MAYFPIVLCSNIMPAIIIDGRKTREALLPGLIEKIRRLSRVPNLAIIQVGDRPDSASFIRAKKIFAEKIGVNEKHIQASENISQKELVDVVRECNADSGIHGIIVQLPLPAHIDRDAVINAINPQKDVDALTRVNVKEWSEGRGIVPATARGIRELLSFYKISLRGKKVTVVGRSELVGKPIAAMCGNEGAVVTVCHSQTADLAAETKTADILIAAAGKPGLIRLRHVSPGQVVIDVGISRINGERLAGDVDFESVKNTVSAISSVPGGVGPMTVLALFENLADLCSRQFGH
jgi:methylenetetrahydrofolate dehydrogenase (NADP+)/methenyltetrahydrofolate cyclohydrolase